MTFIEPLLAGLSKDGPVLLLRFLRDVALQEGQPMLFLKADTLRPRLDRGRYVVMH
jgi:hypothetical protein